MLPGIHAAVGDRVELILDSGIRRGSDVIIALCLGARSVLFGRPPLYGAAAAGMAGVKRAFDILSAEIDKIMAQIGCRRLCDLGPHCLRPTPGVPEPATGRTPAATPDGAPRG